MFSKAPLNDRANKLLSALAKSGEWTTLSQIESHIGALKDGDTDLLQLMAGQHVIQARRAESGGEHPYEYRTLGNTHVPDLM